MDNDQKLDADFIEKLAVILNDGELHEIEVKSEDFEIRIVKNPESPKNVTYNGASSGMVAAAPTPVMAAAPVAAAPTPVASTNSGDLADHAGAVKSPMVGTAYLASEPGTPNFVQVGDNVQKGQTLLIVEAMKTMNNISAPAAGKVVAILIDNEDPIEFGQSLIVIE